MLLLISYVLFQEQNAASNKDDQPQSNILAATPKPDEQDGTSNTDDQSQSNLVSATPKLENQDRASIADITVSVYSNKMLNYRSLTTGFILKCRSDMIFLIRLELDLRN